MVVISLSLQGRAGFLPSALLDIDIRPGVASVILPLWHNHSNYSLHVAYISMSMAQGRRGVPAYVCGQRFTS